MGHQAEEALNGDTTSLKTGKHVSAVKQVGVENASTSIEVLEKQM